MSGGAKAVGAVGEGRWNVPLVVGVRKGLMAWAALVQERAANKAPVDTSVLANSIVIEGPIVGTLGFNSMEIKVGPTVEYGRAQELGSGLYGTGPGAKREKYPIVPKFKKALSFAWPGGPDPHPALQTEGPHAGKYVFGKVMHPGVRPQPYLVPALKETLHDGRRLLIKAITAELRNSSRGAGTRITAEHHI